MGSVKLDCNILGDYRIGTLSNRAWRRYIELMLYCEKYQTDGLLDSLPDIAWVLRTSHEELSNDIDEMLEHDLIKNESGELFFEHWQEGG